MNQEPTATENERDLTSQLNEAEPVLRGDERSKDVISYFSSSESLRSPDAEPSASEIVAAQEYARKKVKAAKDEYKKKKSGSTSRLRLIDGRIVEGQNQQR